MSEPPKIADVLPDSPEKDAILKELGADATVAALAKSAVHAKQVLGKSFRVPEKDAKPEEWESFYGKMGRPQKPDDYKVPEKTPTAIKSILEGVRQTAHKRGLTQEQFEALAEDAATRAGASQKQIEELRTAWEKKFRDEHGSKADERLRTARDTMDRLFSDPETKAALVAAGLENHPALLNAILKVGEAMGDDRAPFGASPAQPAGMTPEQIRNKIWELKQDPEYKNNVRRSPKRDAIVNEIHRLTQNLIDAGYDGASDPKLNQKLDWSFLEKG